MPGKAAYACLDSESKAAYVLSIDNASCDLLKVIGLDSAPIGVYEDCLQNVIHVVTEAHLNVFSYNKRSKQFLRRSNYQFAASSLQLQPTVLTLTEKQQHFRHSARLSLQSRSYDQYSYEQQFLEDSQKGQSGQVSGHHKVLDYLSLSLSLPLYYHPHNALSQKFTKSVKDLLPCREKLRRAVLQHQSQEDEAEGHKVALRILVKNQFEWNSRYKSDFSQDFYQAQGAVTPLVTGKNAFSQQMLVINTKDMINIFKSRMKALSESIGPQEGSAPEDQQQDPLSPPNISADFFQNSKWPTRLLSLVHPFSLDENLDENLELFFGLSIPFVDCRIGVQGTDEAFSFIIADDREKHEFGEESGKAFGLEDHIKLLKTARVHAIVRQESLSLLKDRQPE